MRDIVNYPAMNCSKELNDVLVEMNAKAKDRRKELERLDAQVAAGNVFAERYRDNLLSEREDELLRSAEILHKSLH